MSSSSPLDSLTTAAQGAVRNTVDWAFGKTGGLYGPRNDGSKSDPVLAKQPLDKLRRAAYDSVFDTLFTSSDRFPFVVPDKTLKEVLEKLASNMFPKGTKFTLDDETSNAYLQELLKQTKFQLKTESVITESALMGYSGIRTIFDNDEQQWLFEVKPKEYLTIETPDGKPEMITAISVVWPIVRTLPNGKQQNFWKKERWTVETYQQWAEKPETMGKMPEFKPEDASSEINNYGEIPITLVPHYYDANCVGRAVCNAEEVLTCKALMRLHHKRHYGHQKHMDPSSVRINHNEPGENLDLGIGSVIDLQQADPSMPTDLKLLEYVGMPESVELEFEHHRCALYRAAGLKPVPKDGMNDAAKVPSSGVALRILDKDDAKTIETLRDNGYSQILRALEKMLRMSAFLGQPKAAGIIVDNPDTWTVTADFPDFFPPTDDDIAIKLANMKAASLPPVIMARMVAALFGLESEEDLLAIQTGIEEEKEAMKPTLLVGSGA